MGKFRNKTILIILLVLSSSVIKFGASTFMSDGNPDGIRFISSLFILIFGAFFVLRGCAQIIEETTEILSHRTKLAGGLLQSLGTAFPDMVLGVVAALISLRLRESDYNSAINYAIIAASTTFGSNIYNIGHAAWCIYRQNRSNARNKIINMFPYLRVGGTVKPIETHSVKPNILELDDSIEVANALTILTALVAISMVLFGQVKNIPQGFHGDLYQLIRPVGVVILLSSLLVLYFYRKSKRSEDSLIGNLAESKNYYAVKSLFTIISHLLFSGLAILFAAETMVSAIETICNITGLPFVIAGVLSGLIGCLGEMIVVHNFTVHPEGRLGDAVTGVAMDNIVTIMGASIVAVMGGIFLGGNSLILIFVVIFALNSTLIWQISELKSYLLSVK